MADGVVRSVNAGSVGEAYHFSPQRFLTIREVVEIICSRMDIDFSELVELAPDRPGKDMAYLMDTQKARSELNWQESVSIEEGIDATIEWVRDSFNEISRLPLDYIHKV